MGCPVGQVSDSYLYTGHCKSLMAILEGIKPALENLPRHRPLFQSSLSLLFRLSHVPPTESHFSMSSALYWN
jgi:hypothetical protein